MDAAVLFCTQLAHTRTRGAQRAGGGEMSDKEYIATARATHDQDGHGREFEECQYGVCKAANLLTERAALEADNARLREAVAAMVTATATLTLDWRKRGNWLTPR
jgi:hypothetical protein